MMLFPWCGHATNAVARLQMSPYCSIAFHPLDGMLQASPYIISMFLVPTHYLTSLVMLFYSGIWASNIHVRACAVFLLRVLSVVVFLRRCSCLRLNLLWRVAACPFHESGQHLDDVGANHGRQVPHGTPRVLRLQLWAGESFVAAVLPRPLPTRL